MGRAARRRASSRWRLPRLPLPRLALPGALGRWWGRRRWWSKILWGLFALLVLALPLGLAIAFSSVLRRTIYPFVVCVEMVPKIAFAPLFISCSSNISGATPRAFGCSGAARLRVSHAPGGSAPGRAARGVGPAGAPTTVGACQPPCAEPGRGQVSPA